MAPVSNEIVKSCEEMVPISKAYECGQERELVMKVIESGKLSGPGFYSQKCEERVVKQVGSKAAAIVPSCSAALEMCALLIDIGPGDEVIMPSFTFVSTANAVVLRGGVPVFVDIDPITQNICPKSVSVAITPRTKAVFVVHYAGVPADMNALMNIAINHGIYLVEDAAQAYGSYSNDRPAGSFGALACFSFHGTKNISAGECGAIVINDEDLIPKMHILREKGTNRTQFMAGEAGFYNWQGVGSSQIVSELTAAYLYAQLNCAAVINEERRELWEIYLNAFKPLAEKGFFALPSIPESICHNAHIFFLMMPDKSSCRSLIAYLSQLNIQAFTHYMPLHDAPAGLKYARVHGQLLNTQRAAECLLRIPLFNGLGYAQERVVNAITAWCHSNMPSH